MIKEYLMFRPQTLSSLTATALLLLIPLAAFGDASHDMQQSLDELKALRREVQQKTIPLLVLMKQLEGGELGPAQQRVKVIKPVATIRETDDVASRTLLVARLNDEFPVIEQRDQWHRIRLADGREGWIHEDVVQVFAASAPSTPVEKKAQSPSDTKGILTLAAGLIKEINARQDTAARIASRLEETYQRLPEAERQQLLSLYNDIAQERDKIAEYHIYANHFYEKYAAHQEISNLPLIRLPRGITGQLSIQTGKSAYESQSEESLTARDLNFTGSMQLNDRSQVTVSLTNRSEVIQTPYSANDIRLGHIYQAPNGLSVNSYAAYHGYNDKGLDRNTFKNLGAGVSLRYPLNAASSFFTELNYDSKDYKEDGGNNYQGGQFNIGWRRQPHAKTQLTMNLRGLIQSSDISFLDFKRFMPQIEYWRRTNNGKFGARLEAERIGYAEEARGNDFRRERLDLTWSSSESQHQVTVIGKQFANDEEQNYIKLAGRIRRQKARLLALSRTELSLLLVFFPKGGDRLSDYLDLRLDRSHGGNHAYFDFSLFGRAWRKTEASIRRDHVVDLYSRFGLKISKIQVGPLVGAHLLLNKEEKAFKRDGNSLRAGADINGNFLIKKATVNFAVRYEKDFVFGSEIAIDPNSGVTTLGEVVTRRPTTWQISAGTRIPLAQDLEFRLDLNRYNIDLDVDDETSINPVSTRSRMMIIGGFGYRFGSN
jgi:hypothetical protein